MFRLFTRTLCIKICVCESQEWREFITRLINKGNLFFELLRSYLVGSNGESCTLLKLVLTIASAVYPKATYCGSISDSQVAQLGMSCFEIYSPRRT